MYARQKTREPGSAFFGTFGSIPGDPGASLLLRTVDFLAVNNVFILDDTTTVTVRYGDNRFDDSGSNYPAFDAAATTLGTTCGSILRQIGGLPQAPNPGYALRTEGPPSLPYAVLVGTKHAIGALPLPFPLGTLFPSLQGCSLYSDVTLTLPGATSASGLGVTPFPIPAGVGSTALQNQVLMLGVGGEPLLSNAHASAIE